MLKRFWGCAFAAIHIALGVALLTGAITNDMENTGTGRARLVQSIARWVIDNLGTTVSGWLSIAIGLMVLVLTWKVPGAAGRRPKADEA